MDYIATLKDQLIIVKRTQTYLLSELDNSLIPHKVRNDYRKLIVEAAVIIRDTIEVIIKLEKLEVKNHEV